MPNHIEVVVGGVTYNNIRAAWRATAPDELPEITVRWRLANGWHPDDAFTLPAIEPTLRRLGHNELSE
jgi:hypothetical protein